MSHRNISHESQNSKPLLLNPSGHAKATQKRMVNENNLECRKKKKRKKDKTVVLTYCNENTLLSQIVPKNSHNILNILLVHLMAHVKG